MPIAGAAADVPTMSAFISFDSSTDHRTTALRRVRAQDLAGEVVVVTGASGALGKDSSLALYQAGATFVGMTAPCPD